MEEPIWSHDWASQPSQNNVNDEVINIQVYDFVFLMEMF